MFNCKVFFSCLWFAQFSNLVFASANDYYLYTKDSFKQKVGNLEISLGETLILKSVLKKGDYEPALLVELGLNLKKYSRLPQVHEINEKTNGIRLEWDKNTFLEIKQRDGFCHDIVWNTSKPVEDCVDYGNMDWYGGSELYEQLWPVQKLKLINLPFITTDRYGMSLGEPFWINSKGLFIFVHYDVPLFIDSRNHKNNSLCFISNATFPYNPERLSSQLKYTVCQLDDPRKAREYAVQQGIIGKPIDIPDLRMVKYPVWSTWVKYKSNVNDTAVLKFAKDIVHFGFNNSQIEIDDNWEECYGSMTFNKKKFPDMKLLSKKLKRLGFRITLWRHPFVNTDCANYSALKQNNFFVRNASGFDVVYWWDGIGSVYDFTNETVKKWFQKKHIDLLEETGIDGFKFDSGEASYIPPNSLLNGDPQYYPNSFTAAYVNTVAAFSKMTEARVGQRSQKYPIFVRMLDKNSLWDFNGGLPTLITTCLLMNVIGYSWVLPDMVAGNSYGNKITEELFVRWLQANTFMPVIQFSFSPWDFNNNTIVEISKKFTSLHYEYSEKIIELMKKSVQTGAPLNSPIWWIDPKDPIALSIDSEYLLGEEILVAPILEKGSIERDIYLPRGEWKDGNNENILYKGPLWIRKYPADLSTLPFFIKISS